MQRKNHPTPGAADLLAELLGQSLDDGQPTTDAQRAGGLSSLPPPVVLRLGTPASYAAPLLRPTGRVAGCVPARPWATGGVARPLRVAGAALLAGALLAASAGVAPAQAGGVRHSVAGRFARSIVTAPARNVTMTRTALRVGVATRTAGAMRAGGAEVAESPAAPAHPAAARAARPADLPAFELEAAPARVAPAAQVAAIPHYVTMQLPAVDLAAQVLPQPAYPQNAPPPPAPPAPGQPAPEPPVIIYQPPAAPAPAPGRPAARPAQPAARPAARPAPRATYPMAGANYIVQRGDYLRLISHWSYANERLWPVIYDSNLRVIGANPDLIHPGQVLAIPRVAGRPAPPSHGARTYTVRPGDTLAGIAARHYGNANRWPEIYWANRSAIGAHPGLIFPGTTLRLP